MRRIEKFRGEIVHLPEHLVQQIVDPVKSRLVLIVFPMPFRDVMHTAPPCLIVTLARQKLAIPMPTVFRCGVFLKRDKLSHVSNFQKETLCLIYIKNPSLTICKQKRESANRYFFKNFPVFLDYRG